MVTSQSLQSPKYNLSHNWLYDSSIIVQGLTLLALFVSSLSAILNKSSHAILAFSVSFVGDSCDGVTTSLAPVQPVSVSATISASVAISVFPATVVLALETHVPVSTLTHAQLTYCWTSHKAVLYIIIPLDGVGIQVSLAVASAYTGNFILFVNSVSHEYVISTSIVWLSESLSKIWDSTKTTLQSVPIDRSWFLSELASPLEPIPLWVIVNVHQVASPFMISTFVPVLFLSTI